MRFRRKSFSISGLCGGLHSCRRINRVATWPSFFSNTVPFPSLSSSIKTQETTYKEGNSWIRRLPQGHSAVSIGSSKFISLGGKSNAIDLAKDSRGTDALNCLAVRPLPHSNRPILWSTDICKIVAGGLYWTNCMLHEKHLHSGRWEWAARRRIPSTLCFLTWKTSKRSCHQCSGLLSWNHSLEVL